MSSGSSSYEDFLNLPRRVFLDSSVLHNAYKYGRVLFENQDLGVDAGIRKWRQGAAEIASLRNI
jgi:hypothetical protein